jgi:hypothetical protein
MKRFALTLAALALSATAALANDGKCTNHHYNPASVKGDWAVQDEGVNSLVQFNDVSLFNLDGAGHVFGVYNNGAFGYVECMYNVTGTYTVSPAGWFGMELTSVPQVSASCPGGGPSTQHYKGVIQSANEVFVHFSNAGGPGAALLSGVMKRQK